MSPLKLRGLIANCVCMKRHSKGHDIHIFSLKYESAEFNKPAKEDAQCLTKAYFAGAARDSAFVINQGVER